MLSRVNEPRYNKCMKDVFLIGDIHGEFHVLSRLVSEKYDLRDCILICVGDLGIGFHSGRYLDRLSYDARCKLEIDVLKVADVRFKERNILFKSIRGNHDDKSHFVGKLTDNIELLPDYHTEEINGELWQFIGGGTSVDRVRRIKGTNWWPDEVFELDRDKIVKCDVLVTHIAPYLVRPTEKSNIRYWLDVDGALGEDLIVENLAIDTAYDLASPKTHYCGHYHISVLSADGERKSRILDINEVIQHRQ